MLYLFFLLSTALANPDFVNIEEGEPAPFAGKLLSEEALASIIAKNEREIEQCKIDADFTFKEYQARQTLRYELLDVRYQSESEMYRNMIEARDAQIKRDKKKDVWQRWAVYGAFVLGVGTTVGITYAVNQNFN